MNLTSIKLTVTGAQAWATVTGPLTSGMVGLPVTIKYDDAWDGLTKNLVCRCSPWGSDDGEIRTILNVGKTAAVSHEVMQAGMYLHLGIEGYSSDRKLVIPTTWARCREPEQPEQPAKMLTGISAVYDGGNVSVGTSVSGLTGISVTAAQTAGVRPAFSDSATIFRESDYCINLDSVCRGI